MQLEYTVQGGGVMPTFAGDSQRRCEGTVPVIGSYVQTVHRFGDDKLC